MNITLKKAGVEDAEDLAGIGWKTFEESWAPYYTPEQLSYYLTENYKVEQVSKEIQDPDLVHFLAYADDEVAGYMKVSLHQNLGEWIKDNCVELCRIYVFQKFQKLKIGKLLMEKCIEIAKEEKSESIVLGVWEENHKAVRFYQQFGFEHIGTHDFRVGERVDTDWVMRKKL